MQAIVRPNAEQKIELLSGMATFECEGEPTLTRRQQAKQDFLKSAVAQVQTPGGAKTVLRTLQSSACEKNCRYCPFRAGRNEMPRVTFSPQELADEFDKMQRAKVVSGLFLSSGIVGGGVKTMDKMLATAEILRGKHHYHGYLHLKVMPGADEAQIDQAARLADRISVNLEGANSERLAFLAPQKQMKEELLSAMLSLHRSIEQAPFFVKPPSIVTQFVVGPAGESDHELLTGVDWLYRKMNLARAYYSAFRPVRNTPLENYAPTPLTREHRLYQADWLLRFYGFQLNELPFDSQGALPTHVDPKLAWAREHLTNKPIEINQASRAELLRVPGIGIRIAETILKIRRTRKLSDLSQLKKLGVSINRAASFILLNGKQPPRQLELF